MAPLRSRLASVLARLKRPLLYVMGLFYVGAGLLHFVYPQAYAQAIPPVFPARLALAYLSGVAEVVLGIAVLYPPTRRLAAWGIIALLVAVFPANVYMATSGVVIDAAPAFARDPSTLTRWARLPFQAVFIAWAWWYTRPNGRDRGAADGPTG
ncbi:DoxX family protein [Natronomonas sp. EA1]|uniref:DoxX family protein n=1 Tax=Natronomonas sp. EA1 TaxID=3421655 RepID=UPI003EBEA581